MKPSGKGGWRRCYRLANPLAELLYRTTSNTLITKRNEQCQPTCHKLIGPQINKCVACDAYDTFLYTRVEGLLPQIVHLTHIFRIPEDTKTTRGERGWGEIGEDMGKRDGGDHIRDGRERWGRLLPLPRLQRQRGWLNHRNQGPPHMVAGFIDFRLQQSGDVRVWVTSDDKGFR
ncbi:hypothetical protein HanHA300_Chr03g0088941 [Helianthus annuus]|nr:hypothetical protein HanHA300_Chr03g0088941 [Helianthus annuus]KAJ0607765.1 hypothetical protein HanHA89_Chr03g0100591 [Helianthus annuus]KAJ0767829.1 hypothetical protein HanLR1_Chr03g0093961 [Helianthus annuus]